MIKITADEVQFRYPNPMRSGADRWIKEDGYCVLGALSLTLYELGVLDHSCRFPIRAAKYLQKANPALTISDATMFAQGIMEANDSGNFDEAWLRLREALKWEPE